MDRKIWKTKAEKVVNLLLDENNIRLDTPIKSQDALIYDLFVNQDAFEIVESIARNGLFPHELPIAIEEKGKLIVLEGNRRIAALKAIINPSLIPLYASKIEGIKQKNKDLPIMSVELKISPSRAEAIRIIASIHTKNTLKPWAPLRQAYFYSAQIEGGSKTLQQLIKEYPGIDIPKFIRMWEMHTVARSIKYDNDEDARAVSNQQKFPITTLERLYEKEQFRKIFKFDFDEYGHMHVNADKDGFKESLKPVMIDIVNKIVDSRNSNTLTDIEKHLKRWKSPMESTESLNADNFIPLPVPEIKAISKGLVPKGIICTLDYPALKRVLSELQTIDYRRYPNATHDLLRTFLECSLKAYFDHKGINIKSKNGHYVTLNDVLKEAEVHFQTARKALVQPIKIIENGSQYLHSEDYLNAINHNPNVFSIGANVKDAWEQMQPVLRYILDPK